jgi:hypothetical protein
MDLIAFNPHPVFNTSQTCELLPGTRQCSMLRCLLWMEVGWGKKVFDRIRQVGEGTKQSTELLKLH